MFGRRKQVSSEVVEAVRRRDELIGEVEIAVAEVDRLHDELLDEYRVAEERRQENQWS